MGNALEQLRKETRDDARLSFLISGALVSSYI